MTSTQTPVSQDTWRPEGAPSPAEGPTEVLVDGGRPGPFAGPQWGPPQSFPQGYPAPQWGPPLPPVPPWGMAPWPVPPRNNARKWAVIAGALAAVTTVSAVTIAVTAGRTADGRATAAGSTVSTTVSVPVPTEHAASTPTTEPDEQGPPPEPASLLLSAKEVGRLVNGSMTVLGQRDSLADSTGVIDESDCLSAWGPLERRAYTGSGYDQAAMQALKDGDTKGHIVIEGAVSFESSAEARDLVEDVQRTWRSCAGRTITATNGSGERMQWQFGTVESAGDVTTISQTPEGSNGWMCERAVGASGRIVVDTLVCGANAEGEGSAVAGAIAKNADSEGA